jgi:hypothetical protein
MLIQASSLQKQETQDLLLGMAELDYLKIKKLFQLGCSA